ncbi:UNVERIFIED_CONTAM: 7-deoxyloganetin glucosyltransferase [Sesamum radiatum]|uniref:Glycosyltransferase n=1 Tax=Sesamum radiatum TaxID=300843 RepID=A0AAW2RYI2_SESRA
MEFIQKPHAVCIPLPAQGHINPMLSLAKLLHSRGFYITFVHTEFNYHKLLDVSLSSASDLESSSISTSVEDFQFETVSDGLPPDNLRGILDLPALACSVPVHTLESFRQLIKKLNSSPDVPPVSCIVSDGVMGFTLKAAREFGIPEILFFTLSACGVLGYLQFEKLIEKGYFPLKDESYLCNGYLDTTTVEWTTSMGSIRLRDLPTFLRATDADDILFNYNMESVNNAVKTGSLILNTFDELEQEVLDVLKTKFPNLYTVGPLPLLCQQICDPNLESIKSSLWREDEKCLEWLDGKEARSVVYVNYGSLVIMTPKQLQEFAWGLANSKYPFLWVIRPNLVDGGTEVISQDFLDEIKGRGLILDWCPQEKVLSHPSVGAFLTHCGWNSTLESICQGVPIFCWPFFAEQQMNCLYACTQWGIGMEIDADVERREVEGLLREVMEGRKGVELREKVLEWKKRGERASRPDGSSYANFDLLVENLKGGMHSCKP